MEPFAADQVFRANGPSGLKRNQRLHLDVTVCCLQAIVSLRREPHRGCLEARREGVA